METAGKINFPKLEQEKYQWMMFIEDQVQRTLQIPTMLPTFPSLETNYGTCNIPNYSIFDFATPLNTQPNFISNEIVPQTLENNMGSADNDFDVGINECPLISDDEWNKLLSELTSTTIPCTFDNNNPKQITSFDQNEFIISDQFASLNNTNLNDYYLNNDQSLSVIVAEGLNMTPVQGKVEVGDYIIMDDVKPNVINKVPKIESISYEEIRKYFDKPISRAAKELNVGLTVLKKRCRELDIKRWPHRKIKSLEALISNVKELGMMDMVQELEEYKRMLLVVPGLEFPEKTKKLRQTCFKANYKKRRAALTLTQ